MTRLLHIYKRRVNDSVFYDEERPWGGGPTGFLVGKNDELNFVNSMQEALTIDNMVNENAYHQVLNHYTNKSIAKDFEKTYTIILNQKLNYAI